MDRFEELLKELGGIINAPLHPDKHRVCKLNVNNYLHIQLEHDAVKERLLIATFLCEIPAGKFRENVLKDALKANTIYPRIGTLCYSERNNQLSLFEYFSFYDLTAAKLSEYLNKFIDRAMLWKTAVEKGQSSPQEEAQTKKESSSIFDLSKGKDGKA
jgi:hypothetical protein